MDNKTANRIVIDATNLIAGRLASFAAKNALLGKEVLIVNSRQAVISGNKKDILRKFRGLRKMGTPTTGPFYPNVPRLVLRRIVRGMLPFHQHKGRLAFRRVKAYNGIPEGLDGGFASIKGASNEKLPTTKFITLNELCREIGYRG
ncbi:50S ribosomal protein L13 [archaeon]|nr:50S ribosomal protein L13 [archaeon]